MVELGEQGLLLVGDPWLNRIFLVVDVEAFEEGLVEETAHFGTGVPVEGIWVSDEVEGMSEYAHADCELLGGVRQPSFESFAFVLELDQLHADFGLWHGAVGEQIDQPGFLLVELLQLPVQTCVRVTNGGLFVGYDLLQEISALSSENAGELEGAIVLDHCVLNGFDREAR
ncbi:hypothetical protein [Nocardia sp. NPDC052566]|uniref:hypothetical protein n=1 Tax=Nocardia sp. NPDC052566 TaxID=3364330 RepID=UPI0037C5BF37